MLDIVIPSKTEKFLDNTIRDVLANATGDITVYPVLDGYDCPRIVDDRVRYIQFEPTSYTKKRHAINKVAEIGEGEYLMSLDAHCMVAKGFDEQLVKDHQPNWVQIPRRHRLDAENWCLQTQVDDRPPIDYEYIMWSADRRGSKGLHGFKWDARTLERWDVPIDDTMTFQGSCWFMTKDWFKERGFMKIDGYTGWGQEAEEIGLETWKHGGRVVTNKNTWYAHLHKGKHYGRMYFMSNDALHRCYEYSWKYWVHDNKEFFIKFIEKFWPVPNWPKDWKEQLYGNA